MMGMIKCCDDVVIEQVLYYYLHRSQQNKQIKQ
jgi:hypothetical protein